MDSLDTLLPLFRLLVRAELASLTDTQVKHNYHKKKVNFCSIDNSSMITPVDTEKGSEDVIENCISSLHEVLHEAGNLQGKVREGSLNNFISILLSITATSSNPLLEECSKVGTILASIFESLYVILSHCNSVIFYQYHRLCHVLGQCQGLSQHCNTTRRNLHL